MISSAFAFFWWCFPLVVNDSNNNVGDPIFPLYFLDDRSSCDYSNAQKYLI